MLLEKTIKKITSGGIAVIIFFCFFIFNHFYSIYFRWHNHAGPIGLDDADYYISRIAYYKDHTFTKAKIFDNPLISISYFLKDFYGLTSLLPLGKIALLMDISAERMFYYNFYIGIFLMGLILWLILREFSANNPLGIAIGLLIFAFYTGGGRYHGFFWVTPSFYCVLLCLLAIWVFFFSRRWKIYAPFVVCLLFFSHPASPFCIALICASLALNALLEKKLNETVKKIVFLLLLSSLYFGIYHLLLKNELISPLFLETNISYKTKLILSGKFEQVVKPPASRVPSDGVPSDGALADEIYTVPNIVNKITTEFQGLRCLWSDTPFSVYFLGWLFPLTAGSIFFCFIRRQYKLLSLFISAFVGTFSFCILDTVGVRTFLFLELILLFVISYGIQQSVLFFWNNRREIFKWKSFFLHKKSVILGSGMILLFACGLILYLFYIRISVDFTQRFRTQRVCNNEKMASFLKENLGEKKNYNKIFYAGHPWGIGHILSFDGAWDRRETYVSRHNVMLDNANTKLLGKSLFIGENVRMYKKSKRLRDWERDGFTVLLPPEGRLILNTENLSAGNYRIIFSDTGIFPEQFPSHVKLEIQKNGTFKEIPVVFGKKPLNINIPRTYPKFMLPWYSLAAKYIHKKEPNYLTVRETFQYFMDFSLTESTGRIFIKNQGEKELSLIGSIDILTIPSQKNIFTLDIDREEAQSITAKAALFSENEPLPLLWTNANHYDRIYIISPLLNKPVPVVFELVANWGDVKAFRPYNKIFYNLTEYPTKFD